MFNFESLGAAAGEWDNPFQASLVLAGASNNLEAHFCGEVFLSSGTFKAIATATHCADGLRLSDFKVVAGTGRLDGSSTRLKVLSIRMHPKPNKMKLDFDIAVIQVVSNALAYPVNLALNDPVINEPLLVTGCGRLNENGAFQVDSQALNVPVIGTKQCNSPGS